MIINKDDLMKRAKPSVDSLRNVGLDANYVSADSNGEVWAWQCKPQIYQEWWFGDKRVGGCWLLFRFDEPVSNWDDLCLSV